MSDLKQKFEEPTPEFYEFVAENIKCDPSKLRLKYAGKDCDFDYNLAIDQVESRRKCKTKLSRFISHPTFLFPNTVSAEQASHQGVARFHASLIEPGLSVADMTAGLGIDAITISRVAASVRAIELDQHKADVLRHNATVCGSVNLTVVCGDSIIEIDKIGNNTDVIFIDPARRGVSNSRVYNLRDCQPDIIRHLDHILSKCRRLFIKASPLLDVSQTLADLHSVVAVRAVSVNGECKELLVELADAAGAILFESVNLDNDGNVIARFTFKQGDGDDTELLYAGSEGIVAGNWLYEPDSSVMKLAPWKELTRRYPTLQKLAPLSHIFVSREHYPDFPGRIMRIEGVVEKKHRKTLKGLPVNIVSRNYPVSADELRKTLRVKEGKDKFLYATRLGKNPVLITAVRIYTPQREQSDCWSATASTEATAPHRPKCQE